MKPRRRPFPSGGPLPKRSTPHLDRFLESFRARERVRDALDEYTRGLHGSEETIAIIDRLDLRPLPRDARKALERIRGEAMDPVVVLRGLVATFYWNDVPPLPWETDEQLSQATTLGYLASHACPQYL